MARIRRQGSVTVIAPIGSLIQTTIERIDRHVTSALQDRPAFVVLDLGEVPFIDSRGLEYLLDAQDEAVRFGGELKLSNANSLCRDILAVTGVDRFVSLFGDAKTAVGSYSR